jgi:group I intron endonuclease
MGEKEKKYGIIYKATNVENGKVYIGKSVRDMEKRRRQHEYDAKRGSEVHFHRALRKYGTDAFKWEIIDTATTKDELDEKEKYWIAHYDAVNNGYNMTEGGEGVLGWKPSEETRRKWSKTRKGKFEGEKHPQAVLTEKDVEFIYTSGLKGNELAEKFNVANSVIYNIKNKIAWRTVTDKLTQFPITEQQIIDMYLSRMDAEHLAEEYYCSIDFADKVKKGTYYSELTKRFG